MHTAAERRAHAQQIFEAGVAAVQAEALVRARLHFDGRALSIDGHRFELRQGGRVVVVGAGKAAAGMALALEQLLGPQLNEGLVIVKYGHGLPLSRVRLHEAAHPVPDVAGLAATTELMHLVDGLVADDLLVVVLTGGASALMPDLPPGARLDDLRQLTDALLRAGADITTLNAVRKHLSLVKGGQLLRRAQPARVLTLVVSDVVGDPLNVIASGPTVTDPSTYADALRALDRHHITASGALHEWLAAGVNHQRPDTLKHTEGFAPHATVLLGNNATALVAAADAARQLGYRPVIADAPLTGSAETAAVHLLSELRAAGSGPKALLWGGETTVAVRGDGLGGRCQHLALAALRQLRADDAFTLLAAGTDGTDGPTEAAGAFADSEALRLAQQHGLDLADAFARCDSTPVHRQLGTALVTGPTGTNVMDLVIGLIP